MNKALKHRLRWHSPTLFELNIFARAYPNIWWYLTGQNIENMKPRCTFRELGKDCPVVKELSAPESPVGTE